MFVALFQTDSIQHLIGSSDSADPLVTPIESSLGIQTGSTTTVALSGPDSAGCLPIGLRPSMLSWSNKSTMGSGRHHAHKTASCMGFVFRQAGMSCYEEFADPFSTQLPGPKRCHYIHMWHQVLIVGNAIWVDIGDPLSHEIRVAASASTRFGIRWLIT